VSNRELLSIRYQISVCELANLHSSCNRKKNGVKTS